MKNTAMLMIAERQLRSSIAAVIKNVTNPKTTPLAPMYWCRCLHNQYRRR